MSSLGWCMCRLKTFARQPGDWVRLARHHSRAGLRVKKDGVRVLTLSGGRYRQVACPRRGLVTVGALACAWFQAVSLHACSRRLDAPAPVAVAVSSPQLRSSPSVSERTSQTVGLIVVIAGQHRVVQPNPNFGGC